MGRYLPDIGPDLRVLEAEAVSARAVVARRGRKASAIGVTTHERRNEWCGGNDALWHVRPSGRTGGIESPLHELVDLVGRAHAFGDPLDCGSAAVDQVAAGEHAG